MSPSAAFLFDTPEKWSAFLELTNQKDALKEYYFQKPTPLLYKYFLDNPVAGWECARSGDPKYDLRWYLTDCGPDSLALFVGWRFQFHLHLGKPEQYDEGLLDNLLKTEAKPLLDTFERIDRLFIDRHSKASEDRNYHFGSPYDGKFGEYNLAWFAGNETEEFVRQTIAKVEVFRQNPNLTELLRRVNKKSRKQLAPTMA